MRKWYVILMAGVLALVLAACDDSAEPTGNSDGDDTSDMSAGEVYKEALSASEDMESAEVDMDMHMDMDSDDEGAISMDNSSTSEMTMDPFAMHMEGTNNFDMGDEDLDDNEDAEDIPGLGDEMETELYMVDDTMYMYNELMGNWLKMEDAGTDAIEEMAGQEPDPAEQMEMLEDYVDDFSFEQSDDAFILTLDADGDDFNDLFKELMEEGQFSEMFDELDEDGQEVLDNMDINDLSMELTIDKDTFDMKGYDMDMDMSIEVEDQKLDVTEEMESEYSNINNVDDIEVPDDVKDEAVEQDDMGM